MFYKISKTLKKAFFIPIILIVVAFVPMEQTTFKSADQSIEVTTEGSWVSIENAKGTELYLERDAVIQGLKERMVITKETGLSEESTLLEFSARKLFLQTSILDATIEQAEEKNYAEVPAKYYEYTYKDQNLVTQSTVLVFLIKNGSGYQITITAPIDNFELNKPLFNKMLESLKIQ